MKQRPASRDPPDHPNSIFFASLEVYVSNRLKCSDRDRWMTPGVKADRRRRLAGLDRPGDRLVHRHVQASLPAANIQKSKGVGVDVHQGLLSN
jgi:hypothetical protein